MSSYLVIAAVTSTLSQWLLEKASSVLDGAGTTVGRPRDGIAKGINIYLYQATYNSSRQNDDLPTRRSMDASPIQRPLAALDLFYLLTFYGSTDTNVDKDLEPQILLGNTVSVLQSQPFLTQDMIQTEINRRTSIDPDDILAEYDVTRHIEKIILTPLSQTMEDFSKLWSILFQVPYTLSIAYKASTVFIESEIVVQRSLPVRRPDVYVMPFRQPVIENIHSAEGDLQPIVYDSTVLITGRQLKNNPVKIRMGELEVALEPTDTVNTVSEKRISLNLSSSLFAGQPMRAGIQGVSVLHPVMMGEPQVEHYGYESNVKRMVISPVITENTLAGTDLTVKIKPDVGKNQSVIALLNETAVSSGTPQAYSIKAPADNGITDASIAATGEITFSLVGVEPGDYLLRIQVDGAESPLEVSSNPSDPRFNNPEVTVT